MEIIVSQELLYIFCREWIKVFIFLEIQLAERKISWSSVSGSSVITSRLEFLLKRTERLSALIK